MSTYKKLKELISEHERKQVPGVLILIFIGMLLETLGIGLVIPALALMTQKDLMTNYPAFIPLIHFLGDPSQVQLVSGGMLLLLAIYFFKTVFLIFMFWRQNKFIFGLQASVSAYLFKGYLSQPWTFHLQRNSAQLIRNVTTEVYILTTRAIQPGMTMITEGVVLFGIVFMLFVIEPVAAPIVVATLVFTGWIFQRTIKNHVFRFGESRQYHEGMRIQHLQQGLSAAKDVKILGQELNFLSRYIEHNEGSASAARKQQTLSDIPHLWIELLAVGGLAGLVLVLLVQGTALDALLPILGLFAAASFRIAPSANRIMGALQNLRYSLPVINTLYDEIKLLESTSLLQRGTLLPFKCALHLEHIHYRYRNAEDHVLNDISLTIPRGKSVGFIGASGAGKSTLVDVILGLLTPTHGRVKLDGVDIQDNLRGWQDQIGYVPQSIYLTDDTLRRNVAFGLPDEQIDDKAVLRAVTAAQLDDFLKSLPLGMETMVGERGVRLSGGQRQRIGIARALYHDPAVLVLDEATSALDTVTENGVMKAINALHGDKTLLIIAHRLSTVANCDTVYQIEHGCVVETENLIA